MKLPATAMKIRKYMYQQHVRLVVHCENIYCIGIVCNIINNNVYVLYSNLYIIENES